MCVPHGDATLWKYVPDNGKLKSIRIEQGQNSTKTEHSMKPGELFHVDQEVMDDDGITHLRLADGRGWAFTHGLEGDTMCVPMDPLDHRKERTPQCVQKRESEESCEYLQQLLAEKQRTIDSQQGRIRELELMLAQAQRVQPMLPVPQPTSIYTSGTPRSNIVQKVSLPTGIPGIDASMAVSMGQPMPRISTTEQIAAPPFRSAAQQPIARTLRPSLGSNQLPLQPLRVPTVSSSYPSYQNPYQAISPGARPDSIPGSQRSYNVA
jgi:hypothetical protein